MRYALEKLEDLLIEGEIQSTVIERKEFSSLWCLLKDIYAKEDEKYFKSFMRGQGKDIIHSIFSGMEYPEFYEYRDEGSGFKILTIEEQNGEN